MGSNEKTFQFHGGAGDFFVKYVLSLILSYIFILGWPLAFNLMTGYMVDNLSVNDKKLKYSAGYGEVLGFLLINILLVVVTLGIYFFWFIPKTYRFIASHTTFEEAVAPPPAVPAQPETPAATPPQPTLVQ